MTEPCKTCLTGRPNHKRQRIVERNGKRLQVCEVCKAVLYVLPPIEQEQEA